MPEAKTWYPSYDVLSEKEHWDEHTREIVLKRLGPFGPYKFLDRQEAAMVLAIARHIVDESRKEILDYVVHHLDNTLSSPIGESQRKVGTPNQKVLVREGLKAIDKLAQEQYGGTFAEIEATQQLTILTELQQGTAGHVEEWQLVPQKELFQKLATDMVNAYYSHPMIWSEIGYGGPAYPRGYVRVEKGLTDPWEAHRDDDK